MSVWIKLIEHEGESVLQSDGRLIRSYRHKYRYQTDALSRPTDADITSDIGIAVGSPFADDPVATTRSAKVVALLHQIPYQAFEVEYAWSTDAPLPLSLDPDPTTRRTLWSIEPNSQSRHITNDRLARLIVNTAGQPPEGGVPVSVRMGTVIAKRNKSAAGYDSNLAKRLSGRVNSATYLGETAGTVQMELATEEKYEGAYHFWEETYRFAWDPDGFQPQFPSAGLFQMVGGELQRITERDLDPTSKLDNPVQEAEPLDIAGALVPVGSRPGGCYIIPVDYFVTMDFNSFGL